MCLNRRLIVPMFFSLLLVSASLAAADAPVWQWSTPAPTIPDRRAFLWLPPDCKHVRGLVIAVHNMLEMPLFEHPGFRAACSENDLGELIVFSGHDRAPDDDKHPDHPPRSSLDIFLNPNFPKGREDPAAAGADLQKLLDTFATLSGYPELKHVPVIPVGHSSAGSFVWHLYRWNPSRIIAMLPFKTGAKDDGPEGIPVFEVNSEWFDYGDKSNRCWQADGPSDGIVKPRNGGKCLYGYYVDIGGGHCGVSDDSISIFSLFLKTVMTARVPKNSSITEPVNLRAISSDAGWVIDPKLIGKPEGKAMPLSQWTGRPDGVLWYLNQELADAVQAHMAAQLAKKPQQINFVKTDGSVSTDGGTFNFSPVFIDDAGTFKLEARYIDELKKSDLYPGVKLGNSGQEILYRVNSGAVRQLGPDTFRICPHGGNLVPQGNPWEPTVTAYVPGNDEYRPTVRPAHVNVSILLKDGVDQTIDFPTLADRPWTSGSAVPLAAKASSGLPVQFYVISGPAKLNDDGTSLSLMPMPPKAKFPATVIVAAFQWGRPTGAKVKSAGPVIRQFLVTN